MLFHINLEIQCDIMFYNIKNILQVLVLLGAITRY